MKLSMREGARLILASVIGGFLGLFVLGAMFGDVDDLGWLFFPIGVGAVFGLRRVGIPRRLGNFAAAGSFLFAFLWLGKAFLGMHLRYDPLFGTSFDEMAGLIPIIEAFAACVVIGIGLLILLFRKRVPRAAFPECRQCGYNLTGNASGICPECGEKI